MAGFQPTEEQQLIRDTVSTFAREQIRSAEHPQSASESVEHRATRNRPEWVVRIHGNS